MAEALLGVVAEAVFSKALSYATEEISGALAVRGNLEILAEEMQLIQALLADAESKSSSSGLVHLWLERLKDAAADADILLDEFAYELLRKEMLKRKNEKVRSFFSSSNPLLFHFKMAGKIKKINLRMESIFQKSTRIGLRPAEIMNYAGELKRVILSDPFLDDSIIVGRDDDVYKIVSQLTRPEDEKDLSVIGIVGMPGQGKTTVAKLLLRDDEVMKRFEKRIWTCVSDDFNVDKIPKDVLQSVKNNVSDSQSRESMVKDLKREIDGKRFLLVLDDVWNEDSLLWDCMKTSLQEIGGAKGSWIIVTTRSERVVLVMNGSVHPLGELSPEASKKLFEKIAFGNDSPAETPELAEIGQRIVKRCGNVPLAVKAIASLLSSRRDVLEWRKIEESSMWKEAGGVLPSIRLSFDHLPSLSLKQCFAYCSAFPKDSVLEREKLIQQWMAHGLLNPSRGSRLEMEDVGNNYFNTLLERSLFQEAEHDQYGNIRICKMHDLVHDFAMEASKDWCLSIEAGSQCEDIKAVHLSVISRGSKSLDISTKHLSRLRTLILFGLGSISLDELANCKHLSVLVMDDNSVKELPNFIVRLKHLRYLDVSGTSIETLPNTITRLYNLQTLRLRALDKLPRDFEKLVKLRYLYISQDNEALLIPGVRNLTSLRTLPHFMVSRDQRCQIEELQHLRSLEGNLKLFGLENVTNHEEASKADLSSKRNIVSLEFHWSSTAPNEQECNHKDVLDGLKPHPYVKGLEIVNFADENLPSWMVSRSPQSVLGNLVRITLRNFRRCQQIPQLWHLPFLEFVKIENMESVKCIGNEFYGWTNQGAPAASSLVPFSKLKEFHLIDMPDLELWSDPRESNIQLFPLLKVLYVETASKLTRLPDSLSKIYSLKEMWIYGLGLSYLPEGLGGLSSLEELYIGDCPSLVSIPSMQGLRSLTVFEIERCNKFGGLLEGLGACVKLEHLTIDRCPSISFEDLCFPANLRYLTLKFSSKDVDYQVFPWPSKCTALPALELLILRGTSRMQSLPDRLYLPKLRKLEIHSLGEMEALPDWLCYGQSLNLDIWDCPKLAYLPSKAALQRLRHSSLFWFQNCPILSQRCTEGSRPEYYHKIADLTNGVVLRFL